MATRVELVEFICSRLQKLGIVRYRKMFGDYMVYLNEKPVILVCDNIAYVKKHSGIAGIMENAETGIPYNGAKEHYILDVDHEDLAWNMWVNEAELNGQPGVDDDGNGYVDDIHGFNFVVGSGNRLPSTG